MQYIIRKNLNRDFNIFLIGDDHEGTILRSDDGWEEMVDMVNSPYGGLSSTQNVVVHHGDVIDATCIDHPYYDKTVKVVSEVIDDQVTQAEKNFKRIKNKIVCILDGNHPWRYINSTNATKRLCKELKVPYGAWQATITYKDNQGKFILNHFATHGFRNISSVADDPIRKKSNERLILKRQLKYKGSADSALKSMGHSHKLIISPPESELFLMKEEDGLQQHYTEAGYKEGQYIHPDMIWYVNSGSFFRLYSPDGTVGYAERYGFDPITLGFAIARIRNSKIIGIDEKKVGG